MVSKETYEHKHYKHCDEKEADGIAWAFVNKEKMVRFPYKAPPVGPNELRANVLYAGLCHSDVLTVRNHWGHCTYPMAPGHEIVAEVCIVGSEVKDFKKGDLVAFGTLRDCCEQCDFCKEGRENICMTVDPEKKVTFGEYWGGYSTLIQHPASFFFHLPPNFNIKAGAPLLCAGITTFYPIKRFLKPGMKTAVVGIGGLGHMAVKFLHSMGHHVVGLTHSTDKNDFIKSIGVDEVVNTSDPKSMETISRKIDFMINTLPVKTGFQDYVNSMRNGGILVQVGAPSVNDGDLSFNPLTFVIRELTIVASCVGPRKETSEMITYCAEKNVYPMVEEFSFEDFPKAFERLEKGKPIFRCVVNVQDYSKKTGFFR